MCEAAFDLSFISSILTCSFCKFATVNIKSVLIKVNGTVDYDNTAVQEGKYLFERVKM